MNLRESKGAVLEVLRGGEKRGNDNFKNKKRPGSGGARL